MIDYKLRDLLLQDIAEEHDRAVDSFGAFHNAHEGWAVIHEEMDELWEAVKMNQDKPERILKLEEEAVQVAAMALRFLMDVVYIQSSEQKVRNENV